MSSSIKRLLRLVKRNPKPPASALGASATLPSSGITSVDNSQGASAAVAELSGALGAVLEQIDLDGEINSQIKYLVELLDQEASQYDNSQLKEEQYIDWSCTQEQARLISIAWKCAHDTYNLPPRSPLLLHDFQDCTLTQEQIITPSADGAVKAVTFTSVTPRETSSTSTSLPVLIVAIRGTASRIDHMVNINNQPRDASSFINNTHFQPNPSPLNASLQAHSGFLESAKSLDQIVRRKINEYTHQKDGGSHVLFTGHSAGGAVASLLFLRCLSLEAQDSARFSCITFGAPPVVSMPLSIPPFAGVCLNMINEFDFVTRADKPYILSLVNLIRLIHDQDPLSSEDADDTESSSLATDSTSTENNWPLPPSRYHHVGPKVVFLMRLPDQGGSLQLRVVEVSTPQFEKLLFCRIPVHRRPCYAQRIELLAGGRYNRANGWDS